MKRKETPLLRIGLFVLAGFVILMVFVFLIGGKQKLFTSTSIYYARFSNVSNLQTGAPIQISGINVGTVTAIKLPKRSHDSVTVTMKVEEDALQLIRVDSRANISTQGLIGDKYIVLSPGSDTVPVLSPGSTVHGEELKDFNEQLSAVSREIEGIVNDIRSGKGNIGKLIYDDGLYKDIQSLTVDARGSINQITGNVNKLSDQVGTNITKVSDQVQGITSKINNGEGSLGKLINSNELYDQINSKVRAIGDNLALSSSEMRDAMAKFALSGGRFAEDADALKHNFLFKGYFESRGYWDAPDFEQTIDRKIDSLNQLTRTLQDQLHEQRMQSHPTPH
jgi:phospholipid/cholesterol/gamma-HCH transport system substrate-binding protein